MPKPIIDITGQTFNRLTAIECVGRRCKAALWRCRCACGNETMVDGHKLRSGKTKSCGCLVIEMSKQANTVHGGAPSGNPTRLYRIWTGMLNRCRNPNVESFPRYGGRGIAVCAEWHSFKPFRDWAAANGYRDDLSIERRNNDGNYEPDNCTWIPPSNQSRNRRMARAVIRSDGKQFSLVIEAARETGTTTTNIAAAIKRRGTAGGYGWRYA